jgi:hypothetical protein
MDVSKYGEAPIAPEHDLNRLAAFVEQRLDPTERAAVVEHLAACADCREVVAGLVGDSRVEVGDSRSETRTGLRTEDRPEDRTGSRAETRTGLPAGLRWGIRTPMWLPIAASIVLVIGAGWFAAGRLHAPTSTPEAPPSAAPSGQPTPPVIGQAPKPEPPLPDPGTTRRSANEREVGGRRFKLEAGTWLDTAYDQFALLPAVDVRTVAERDALIALVPALKPFLDLGPKVTVVHQGTVYRFDLPR